MENNFGANHDVTLQVQIHEGSNLVTVKYDDTEANRAARRRRSASRPRWLRGHRARSRATASARRQHALDGWSIDLGLPQARRSPAS